MKNLYDLSPQSGGFEDFSCGIQSHVVRLMSTDVSEKHVASIFKAEELSKKEISMKLYRHILMNKHGVWIGNFIYRSLINRKYK
jgi:hypothetical protein